MIINQPLIKNLLLIFFYFLLILFFFLSSNLEYLYLIIFIDPSMKYLEDFEEINDNGKDELIDNLSENKILTFSSEQKFDL